MSSMSLLKELADEMSALNERYSREVVAYCDQLEKRQPPPTENGFYWGLITYQEGVSQVAGGVWLALFLTNGKWLDPVNPCEVGHVLVFVPRAASCDFYMRAPGKETLRRLAGVG
jgi:hypothetical protein